MDQKVKDANNRIAFEVFHNNNYHGNNYYGITHMQVAQLRTQMESQKVESIKYLVGGIFSIVTIILSLIFGLSRLMK